MAKIILPISPGRAWLFFIGLGALLLSAIDMASKVFDLPHSLSKIPDWPPWSFALVGIGFIAAQIATLLMDIFVEVQRMHVTLEGLGELAGRRIDQ